MKLGALSVGIWVMGVGLAGCGSSSKPMTPQCSLNSDCAKLSTPGLVCALGYCVKPCNISSDCPNNERCVTVSAGADAGSSTADAGVAQGTACQAPETVTCQYNSQCKSPLVCGIDQQCRDQCQSSIDCPGMGAAGSQVCTVVTHLCADPSIDKDYDPTTMDFKVDAGATGTGGNGTGGNGTGGNGTGGNGHGGNSGAGGNSGNACPSPQTQFGNFATGDPNPSFTSGVGVRDGNELFVFSGFVTPADAGVGGAAGGNYIYAQAFDSTSGVSKGPSAPLLKAADGEAYSVFDVSVAPTGEIVVLHGGGTVATTTPSQLFASFLKRPAATDGGAADGSAADGGAAGLEVVKTVQLESVPYGEPHAVWSVSAQAFIISWKYFTTSWFIRVRKFLPGAEAAGGDTSAVPVSGSLDDTSINDSQTGTAGSLFGVSFRDYATGNPFLTILDTDGLQVGNILQLSSTAVSHVASIGGTTGGFVILFNSGPTVIGVFVPISGAHAVITDAGVSVDAGDGGIAKDFTTFSTPSTASDIKTVSDDTGGVGGVGAALLETGGASFLYVHSDGTRPLVGGTLISSPHGAQIGLSNYHGSFAISLYDSTTHATQVGASGCN
jgi:hypothetical protein